MIYQVLSPFATTINGDSFKEAIKNFIKLNHNLNITDMIIKDQTQHMKANLNYYKQDGRNKVGIDMYPIGNNYPLVPMMPTQVVVNDPYNPYNSPSLVANFLPMSPISSDYNPFIPMVVNIPIN